MTARVQQSAPAFSGTAVVEGQFQEISLSDYAGKYVVLLFYPLDFTFVCPTELLAFDACAQQFESVNATVIAASVDSHYSHLAWTKTPREAGGIEGLSLPLLADLGGRIARDYGVLLEDDQVARPITHTVTSS